jgi:branched-chain amino acid aminotransferase
MKYKNILVDDENEVLNKPIVYEVIRVIEGKPLFLNEHLIRMKNSIKHFSKIDFDVNLCKTRILKLIENGKIVNQNIRMETGNFKDENLSYKIFSIVSSYPSKKMYSKGVDVITVYKNRDNPEIKIRDDKFKLYIKNKLKDNNMYEIILIDENGKILEGSRSNLFFIKRNKIITSKSGDVLEGITLSNVVNVINQTKLEIVRKNIAKKDLKLFDGAFLTGTSIDILPINKIDDLEFNTAINPIVLDLMNKFNEYKLQDMRGI